MAVSMMNQRAVKCAAVRQRRPSKWEANPLGRWWTARTDTHGRAAVGTTQPSRHGGRGTEPLGQSAALSVVSERSERCILHRARRRAWGASYGAVTDESAACKRVLIFRRSRTPKHNRHIASSESTACLGRQTASRWARPVCRRSGGTSEAHDVLPTTVSQPPAR